MRRLALILALALSGLALSGTALRAVNPDEVLDDPVLEARARTISEELRCVVCQGETIDESNAQIARDLRLLVRERLKAGDTDQQVLDFMVERYGEYVLMKPTTRGANLILWGAGPALLIIAGATALVWIRRRAHAPAETEAELSDEEKERLAKLLES